MIRSSTVRRREWLAGAVLATAIPGCDSPPLAKARPPSRGLSAPLIAEAAATGQAVTGLNSLVVARHGDILSQTRFRGPALDRPVNIKSASKSVLSALVGAAIAHGVFQGVDQTIASILTEDLPPSPDPRLSRITLGHLLSMRAGLQRTSGENYGAWVGSPNWVRYVLSRPFEAEPGGPMLYSTGSSHLLSAALTRASGRSTHALAQDWLAGPLDIAVPPWPRDPQGVYFGGNDMQMSPLALVRFGELYRNAGRVGDAQVLPASWIEDSWRPRAQSRWSGYDYGYGWFTRDGTGHPVHFAWGYGGQMVFVVPDLELTVVMTSDPSPRPRTESHVPTLHRMLDDLIVPAAEQGA